MPSRAFFVLGGTFSRDRHVCKPVSMPSRAFFVLGETKYEIENAKYMRQSQCPRGHFLFWGFSFAVRACFPSRRPSQCPRGHFLFWGHIIHCPDDATSVSMPSRAFFVLGGCSRRSVIVSCRQCLNALAGIFCFGGSENTTGALPALCLNALAGIFCFGAKGERNFGGAHVQSQCPRGHFLFWGEFEIRLQRIDGHMSQCPRGHFLFWGCA